MNKLAAALRFIGAWTDRFFDGVVCVLMPIPALCGILMALCSLALGGYRLWQGSFGWKEFLFLPVGLLWLLGGVGMLLECRDKYFPKRLKAAELAEPARRECALPYATLESRLEEMAAIEPDEVELDKGAQHLAWWDRANRSFAILGLGGEDWLAFSWDGREEVLSRKQLRELCLREGVELLSPCLGYRPTAIAFCRSGRLTVYPAICLDDFGQDIPPLREEAAFRSWLAEARRMGALDV